MKQLIFNYKLADDQTFTTFEVGRNLWVKIFLDPSWGQQYRLIYYYGATKVGKTHLLKAIYSFLTKIGKEVVFLENVGQIESLSKRKGQTRYLLLDNFVLLPEQEISFFNFLREELEGGSHLVIASAKLPQQVFLPDLRSRLMSDLVFELLSLNEQERMACLVKWLSAKNLEVTPTVFNYLLNHVNREINSLFKLIDLLDQQSQITGKKLTVPFVRQVLKNHF